MNDSQRGYSALEMLVSLLVTSLLLAASALFVASRPLPPAV